MRQRFITASLLFVCLITVCLLLTSCTSPTSHTPASEFPKPGGFTVTPTPAFPPLRQGWTSISQFRGTGSKSISNVSIPVNTLWGATFGCQGRGTATVKFSLLPPLPTETLLTADCLEPGIHFTEIMDIQATLQHIEIVTETSNIWLLQVTNCTADEHTCGVDRATPTPAP